MITEAQWLRIWVLSMEVPGSNADKLVRHFHAPFYPAVIVLLEYFNSAIYSCLVLPCTSKAVIQFLLNHKRIEL